MDTISILEINKQEMELILKYREECARKARINELGATLRETLAEIERLGGSVHLPSIGGKYVSRYSPAVHSNNISVGITKWG